VVEQALQEVLDLMVMEEQAELEQPILELLMLAVVVVVPLEVLVSLQAVAVLVAVAEVGYTGQ
jgi:hypothetical protein